MSPFANTRGRKNKQGAENMQEMQTNSESSTSESGKVKRWFSLVDAATLSRKMALLTVEKLRNSLLSNSKLHRTLFGFIVFEVSWNDVWGLNYLNELQVLSSSFFLHIPSYVNMKSYIKPPNFLWLQTYTSLAIEAKYMRRWKFYSVSQAARCIHSWFPETDTEQSILREYLNSTIGMFF